MAKLDSSRVVARSALGLIEQLESRRLLASTATLVEDILSGSPSGIHSGYTTRVSVGNKLFFQADDGVHGREPWVSDGTAAGTHMIKDITPGSASTSQVSEYTVGDGKVFFVGNDGTGEDIYVTDGTDAGTDVVSTAAGPNHLTYLNHKLLFFGTINYGTPNAEQAVLYRTDAGGNQALVSPEPSHPRSLGVADGKWFFEADDSNDNDVLYATNGSFASVIKDIEPLSNNSATYGTGAALGSELIFAGSTIANGAELWRSDGTNAGTKLFADILSGSDSSFPFNFANINGTVYFSASVNSSAQLYSTSGASYQKLTNLPRGSASNFVNIGTTIYFTYQIYDSPTANAKIYKLANGQVTPVGGTYAFNLTPVGSSLFFSDLNSAGARALYEFDGSTLSAVQDGGTDALNLANVNGTLYYEAKDSSHGTELRKVSPAAPPEISVGLRANGRSSATVNEGATVQFSTVLNGIGREKVKKYYYFFEDAAPAASLVAASSKLTTASSAAVVAGPKPSHTYLDDPIGALDVYNVRAKFVFVDGSVKNAYAKVTVRNVNPELQLTFDTGDDFGTIVPPGPTWAANHQIKLTAYVKESNPDDVSVVTIDWGDGTVNEVLPVEAGNAISNHAFKGPSLNSGYVVRVEARDKDGGVKVRKATVFVDSAVHTVASGRIDYARIGGTSGNDTLIITASRTSNFGDTEFVATLNGVDVDTFTLNGFRAGRFIVHMGAGNDTVLFRGAVSSISAIIFGDGGSDTLNGKSVK